MGIEHKQDIMPIMRLLANGVPLEHIRHVETKEKMTQVEKVLIAVLPNLSELATNWVEETTRIQSKTKVAAAAAAATTTTMVEPATTPPTVSPTPAVVVATAVVTLDVKHYLCRLGEMARKAAFTSRDESNLTQLPMSGHGVMGEGVCKQLLNMKHWHNTATYGDCHEDHVDNKRAMLSRVAPIWSEQQRKWKETPLLLVDALKLLAVLGDAADAASKIDCSYSTARQCEELGVRCSEALVKIQSSLPCMSGILAFVKCLIRRGEMWSISDSLAFAEFTNQYLPQLSLTVCVTCVH